MTVLTIAVLGHVAHQPRQPCSSRACPAPSASTQDNLVYSRQDTAGLYLQDQIELPYDFHVMAGLRYQKIHQWSTAAIKTVLSTAFFSSQSSTYQAPDALDEDRVTPRFGLLWRPQRMGEPLRQLHGRLQPEQGLRLSRHALRRRRARGAGRPAQNSNSSTEGCAPPWIITISSRPMFRSPIRITGPYMMAYAQPPLVTSSPARRAAAGPEVDIQGELLPGWNVIVAYTNQDVRISRGDVQ